MAFVSFRKVRGLMVDISGRLLFRTRG